MARSEREKKHTMQLGDFTIDWVSDGRFWLDGGAMFGAVPKVLWSRKVESDERNRIEMGLNAILVRTPHGNVLLDTGIGNKLSPKQVDMFNRTHVPTLKQSLAARGLAPEDVHHVVLSHCDFDHLGGAVERYEDGALGPAFPHAKVHIHATEWQDLTHPNARAKGTYLPENWQTLDEAGVVVLHDDASGEIVPGLRMTHTGGHTRGHVVVEVESRGEGAVYMGDLMPTRHHLNPLWVMAYDNYPTESIAQREHWLATIRERGWWLLYYHEVSLGAGKYDAQGQPLETVPLPAR